MTRRLESDSKAIRRHTEQIEKSEKETAEMRDKIEKLQTEPKIFSNRKCAATGEGSQHSFTAFCSSTDVINMVCCAFYVFVFVFAFGRAGP